MSTLKARKTLRKVAQMVFDEEPGPFSQGLCNAAIVVDMEMHGIVTAGFIRMIKKYMRHNQVWLAKPGTKWKERAMFALLVAEAEK